MTRRGEQLADDGCAVCRHPRVRELDEAVVFGEATPRGAAAAHGVDPAAAVWHLFAGHISSDLLAEASAVADLGPVFSAETLAVELATAKAEVRQLARSMKPSAPKVMAYGELRSYIGDAAKLAAASAPAAGALDDPALAAVITAVSEALRPFPDAGRAVAEALAAAWPGRGEIRALPSGAPS